MLSVLVMVICFPFSRLAHYLFESSCQLLCYLFVEFDLILILDSFF